MVHQYSTEDLTYDLNSALERFGSFRKKDQAGIVVFKALIEDPLAEIYRKHKRERAKTGLRDLEWEIEIDSLLRTITFDLEFLKETDTKDAKGKPLPEAEVVCRELEARQLRVDEALRRYVLTNGLSYESPVQRNYHNQLGLFIDISQKT